MYIQYIVKQTLETKKVSTALQKYELRALWSGLYTPSIDYFH